MVRPVTFDPRTVVPPTFLSSFIEIQFICDKTIKIILIFQHLLYWANQDAVFETCAITHQIPQSQPNNRESNNHISKKPIKASIRVINTP